ncbi:tRNA-guanine transglycosylase DpdA [Methylobacterium brachiatum]
MSRFLYSDSLDQIDPGFDFARERFTTGRTDPFNDDVFAHEFFGTAPYDGILLSYATVGHPGEPSAGGRYSFSRAMRLRRVGAKRFFRCEERPADWMMMGDCGSFSYARETDPRWDVDSVLEFYRDAQFTHGCSLDHIVFSFDETVSGLSGGTDQDRYRFDVTLENAEAFLRGAADLGPGFTPIGVVQGWSPDSMAEAARRLVAMGYDYIAVGGMVPLKVPQIKSALAAVREAAPDVAMHVLGFAKADNIHEFQRFGIDSFDTTSPLLRAFKDAKSNYYLRNPDGGMEYFTAIRIPQAIENRDLNALSRMGVTNQEQLQRLEREALEAVRGYARHEVGLETTLDAVMTYAAAGIDGSDARGAEAQARLPGAASKAGLRERYERTLASRCWDRCGCRACGEIGVEIVLYRGLQRNRRRGYHNLAEFHSLVRDLRCEALPELEPEPAVPAYGPRP